MTTEEMQVFLAGLEAKRDALNDAIEKLSIVLGLETGGSTPGATGLPREITKTTFWNTTIPEGTRTYLLMVKKPQTTAQIAEALLSGGMQTNAKDFPGTVQTILRRFESNDEIIRVPGGEWALSEWFPNRPKRRKAKGKGDVEGETDAEDASADAGGTTTAPAKADGAAKGAAKEPAPPSSPTAPEQP